MKVVCYCRLSKDDNKSRYSSINAQMELAKEYADSQGWNISKYYIDDNVSGYISNDERPQFSQMLQDIDDGKVDIILAKDLSRIGRKGSRTLTFIDELKEKNVEEQKINLKNLEEEYKVLVSQRIKEIASSSDDKREFIENTYKGLEEEKYKEIEKTKRKLAELQNEDLEIKQEKLKQTIDYFNQIIDNDEPDKAILNMLIDKIYIYHDKSVKF